MMQYYAMFWQTDFMSNKWTGSFELLSIERMKIVSQLIFEHFLSCVDTKSWDLFVLIHFNYC